MRYFYPSAHNLPISRQYTNKNMDNGYAQAVHQRESKCPINIEIFSTSLIVKDMQIKATMRYRFTLKTLATPQSLKALMVARIWKKQELYC